MQIENLEPRRLLSTVAINTNTQYQTMEGLGAGLDADYMMFEYQQSWFYDRVANELGASAVRVPILPTFEPSNDNSDPNTFDWSKFDPNSIKPMMSVLQGLKDRGVNNFMASIWTPPWWMKTNNALREGGMLKPEMRDEFAEYCAAVVISAKRDFGIDLNAISLQNEPWFNEPYASAVYTPEQMREVIRAVGRKFKAEGLTTKIVGMEDLDFGGARVGWDFGPTMNDPETNADLYAIAGHTYGSQWPDFASQIAGYNKPFWQTETSGETANGEPNDFLHSGIRMAENLYQGLVTANASEYLYWQFTDPDANRGLMTTGQPNSKFYSMEQYSRYIRPGMKRVDVQSSDPNLHVVAFRDNATGNLTIVAINENTTDTTTSFSLSGSSLPTTFKQFRTSENENALKLSDVTTGGNSLSLTIPAQSIVTLYSGPDYTPITTGRVPGFIPTPPQTDPETPSDFSTDKNHLLLFAGLQADGNQISSLLSQGVDPNFQDSTGWTALMYAAASPNFGSPDAMQRLINGGANVNLKNNLGQTALELITTTYHQWVNDQIGTPHYIPPQKLDILLNAGANINAQDNAGRTALHYAAWHGQILDLVLNQDPSFVNALLLRGANPNIKDASGMTARDYAVQEGYKPQAAALSEAMGNLTETPFRGDPIYIDNGNVSFEAEDFDYGGQSVAYNDTDSTNTGNTYRSGAVDIVRSSNTYQTYNVTNTHPGEWLKYSAFFNRSGTYDLKFSVASATGGGTFHLEVDGANITGPLTVPNTGGDQSWIDLKKSGVNISAGNHILKLVFDTAVGAAAVGNFNSVTIIPVNLGGPVSPPPPPPPPPPPSSGQTPFLGTPFAVTGSSTTTIQAEDFDNGGEGVAYHDTDSVNQGNQYRQTGVDIESVSNDSGAYDVGWTSTGEWLEYSINVANAGSYDLGFRVSSLVDGGKFHAEIDGANITGALSMPNTGGWQNWTTVTKSGINLTAGQHVLRLFLDAGGGNYNYITIKPTSAQPPSGQTPFSGTPFSVGVGATTTIQAEDYDKGGEGIAYHDTDFANNGGAYRSDGVDIQALSNDSGTYNVGWTRAGEWLEYTINVTDPGAYDLGFRVASGVSGASFHAEIDGANVTGALSMPNTGDYQKWTTVTKSGVNLTAGQHILRLAMDVGASNLSVGNYNYITITPNQPPSPPPPPPPPPPAGGQTPFLGTPFAITGSSTVTIQAEDFDNGGEGVAYHDTTAANQGGQYRTTEAVDIEKTSNDTGSYDVGYAQTGEWLEYTVNVADAGSYDFGFRVASAADGGKFHAEIDGTDITGQFTLNNTGGWQSWKTLTKSGVNLTTGQHVLRLFMDANGAAGYVGNFNYITVAPSNQQPPSPPPPPPPPPPSGQSPFGPTAFNIASTGTSTLQAENFDNGGEGVAYHDNDSTNDGGQYRTTDAVDIEKTFNDSGAYDVGWTTAGEWLEYTVNVAQSGNYDLAFRVASNGSGGNFHLEVDGSNVTGALSIPNTAGWQNWTTVTKNSIALSAGQHILKLAMDSNGSTGSIGNFNYINFTPTVAPPQPVTLTNTVATFVQDGSGANTNSGGLSTIQVKTYPTAGTNRQSYLKFDLSSVSTINSAKLRLFGSLNADGSVPIAVYSSTNTSWDENTLTWNNKPATSASPISGTTNVNSTTQNWWEWDITSFLKNEKSLGHNTVTLVLKGTTNATPAAIFKSDDAASNQPQLVIS